MNLITWKSAYCLFAHATLVEGVNFEVDGKGNEKSRVYKSRAEEVGWAVPGAGEYYKMKWGGRCVPEGSRRPRDTHAWVVDLPCEWLSEAALDGEGRDCVEGLEFERSWVFKEPRKPKEKDPCGGWGCAHQCYQG